MTSPVLSHLLSRQERPSPSLKEHLWRAKRTRIQKQVKDLTLSLGRGLLVTAPSINKSAGEG